MKKKKKEVIALNSVTVEQAKTTVLEEIPSCSPYTSSDLLREG
jgi:hypothetical protein